MAAADLPSEIRNGGGNDPERLPFRKRRRSSGRTLRAAPSASLSGKGSSAPSDKSIHLYSYIVSVQSFCGKHTIRSFCLPNIYQIFQIQNKLALMYMISSEIPIFTFIENKNVINVKFMIKKRTISPTATTKPLAGFPLVLFIYTPSLSSNFIKKKKKKSNIMARL